MKIALAGSHGLIGSALTRHLQAEGHTIVPLVRRKKAGGGIYWNPKQNVLDGVSLEGFDAVINLAGENIAALRWNARKKERIRSSRVSGNMLLASKLGALTKPPGVFVSASAIGYYGDCGAQIADESSPPGEGFLADVCREWESAAGSLNGFGIRTVYLRFGLVLHARGGALAKMLPAFRLGLGGRIGSGSQYISWISLNDAVRAAAFSCTRSGISGPVNVVSPMPVTNEYFTQSLAAQLGRPALLPLPHAGVRLVFGEMGETLLLFSSRVLPKRLLRAGFTFEHENLNQALHQLIP